MRTLQASLRRFQRFHLLLALAFVTALCAQAAEPVNPPPGVSPEAWRIHRSALLIDGHNDLPWEMRVKAGGSFEQIDISGPVPSLHTDIPRLRAGGIGAQFWAAYVPAITLRRGGAIRQTLEQIDLIHRMVARYPETFAFASTAGEIRQIQQSGRIACLIGIEGGHAIEESLSALRMFHALGARYMTLTHADSLSWADAATDTPKSNGLSAFGREVVQEMNRLGMLVDISHVSEATMHAALDTSSAPIIASHSSAYAVAPHVRNIPDAVLSRLKTNGGMVMVNFYSGFLVPESARLAARILETQRELREKFPVEADYQKAFKEWREANPMKAATVKDLVDHIDHIRKVAGVEHAGLGGDMDGITLPPTDLKDVAGYPLITEELHRRGYNEREIKLILGENLLRVLHAAEKVAARLKEKSPGGAH